MLNRRFLPRRIWPAFPECRLRVAAATAVVVALAVCRGAAQSPGTSEFEVKAAYLYNFGRFVEWPASASGDESFGICVLGLDPFGQILDTTLRGLAIDGKTVVARRLPRPQDIDRCPIVFISPSERPQLKQLPPPVTNHGALTD